MVMSRSAEIAKLKRDLIHAKSDLSFYKDKQRAEYDKVEEIARLHSPYFSGSGTHPIDLPSRLLGSGDKTVLWCSGCNKPWPCKTYQVATGCPPFAIEFVRGEES